MDAPNQRDRESFTAPQLRDREFPPLFWPVPGLLCEGVYILAGRPKAGKSQLILQLAVAIAGGHEALGRFATNRVGVVYLALEDGDRRIQRRMQGIGQGWPEWLVFKTKVAAKMEDKLAAIRRLLDGFEGDEPAVLFVDTWGRFRPKKGGKDVYADDYEPMAQLATLAQQRPQLTIVVVHHTRKLGDEGGGTVEALEAVSGSYGLTGAADGVLIMDRRTGSAEATLTVVGRDMEERSFLLRREGELLVCLGEGRAGLKPEEQKIIGALIAIGGAAGPSAVARHLAANVETIKKRMQRMASGDEASLTRNSRGMYEPVL